MATWDQIAGYMRSNYKIRDEQDRSMALVFNITEDRSQLVLLSARTTKAGDEWLVIESAIGLRSEVDFERAAEVSSGWPCGGIAVGGDFVMLRHSAPMENLDINELEDPMRSVVLAADETEKALSGRDRF